MTHEIEAYDLEADLANIRDIIKYQGGYAYVTPLGYAMWSLEPLTEQEIAEHEQQGIAACAAVGDEDPDYEDYEDYEPYYTLGEPRLNFSY